MKPTVPIIRASLGSWWRVSLRLRGRRVHGTGLAIITSAFIALGLTVAEPRDFRAADSQSNDHPTARALVHMSELVSDRTQGRHRMVVYPGGVLGEQEASFEQTRTGGIDINRTNMAPFASFVREANIFGLPFLFRSADHLHRVLDGGSHSSAFDPTRTSRHVRFSVACRSQADISQRKRSGRVDPLNAVAAPADHRRVIQ
jgi:TRAP-type C4-dicarboxylate transport system substrate-binding protein